MLVTWLWPVPKALLAVVLLWILSQKGQEPVKLKHSNKWVFSNITRTSKVKFCFNFIPQVQMLTDVSSLSCWKICVVGFFSVASCFNVIVWARAAPLSPLPPLDRWRIYYSHATHTSICYLILAVSSHIKIMNVYTMPHRLVRTNQSPFIEIFFITVVRS